MQAIRLVLALLFCTSIGAAQQLDTLKYNVERGGYVYYHNPDITMQAARFEIAAPAQIHAITVTLGGTSTDGTVRVHVFGHEGGLPAPGVQRDLMQPITIRKTHTGAERRVIELPSPVNIPTHQFFVAFDRISPGVAILSDRVKKGASCIAGDDKFMYQALRDRHGRWQWGEFAYAVEASIAYERQSSSRHVLHDVTHELGLADSTTISRSIAWADVNGDSYNDLLLGGRLYENQRGSRFQDITQSAGLSGAAVAGIFIDVNGDNAPDVLVFGEIAGNDTENVLYINNRDRGFSRKILDMPRLEHPSSISVADANGDGFLDVFVGQGLSADGKTLPYYLFLNSGSNSFTDGTEMLRGTDQTALVCHGAQWADVDGDGDLDLFVVGDGVGGNRLWLHEPDGNFKLATSSEFIPSDSSIARAGCHWYDYDNDGHLDLLLPARSSVAAAQAGGSSVSSVIRRIPGSGYGAVDEEHVDYESERAGGSWGDVDNDGRADLILTTSCDCRYAGLYKQDQSGAFSDKTYEWGFNRISAGNDAMWIDFDNDGRVDLATFVEGRFSLWKNEIAEPNNFLELELRGAGAVGAEATVWTPGAHYTQEVASGRGLLMQEPMRLHFGIGPDQSIDSTTIRWADGHSEVFKDLATNTLHRVDEGGGARSSDGIASNVMVSPNPFSSQVSISYTIASAQPVSLGIYTLAGAPVRSLVNERQTAGSFSFEWEGDDGDGEKVAQGTYIYRLMVGGQETSGRIILVR